MTTATMPIESRVLYAMGRDADAIDAARREEARFASVPRLQSLATALRASLEGRRDDALAGLGALEASGFRDGEGLFYVAELYSHIGEAERARQSLENVANAGFVCLAVFDRDPFLAPVRGCDWWISLRERVRVAHQAARTAFDEVGGREALGVTSWLLLEPTPGAWFT